MDLAEEMLNAMLAEAERDAGIEHVNGVRWHEAPLPKWWHRCCVQTSGWIGLTLVERCACGAMSRNGGRWSERNSRRREA